MVMMVVSVGTVDLWPYLILLQAIPALISLAITPFMPDTPRYLMLIKHEETSARRGRQIVASALASSHCERKITKIIEAGRPIV